MPPAPSSRDSVTDPCTGPLFPCQHTQSTAPGDPTLDGDRRSDHGQPATLLSETKIYVERHQRALEAMIGEGDPASGGEALAKRHACVVDGIVRALFAAGRCRLEQRRGRPVGPIAFGGVGSYGRGRVALGSGHAMRIVYGEGGTRADAISLAVATLEPIRSCGVAMEVQVVSLTDFIAQAHGDLDAALSVLDFRHVVGDASLSERLATAISSTLAADSAKQLLVEALEAERHARHGRTLRTAGFDVRNSQGGLRDLDVLGWMARATTSAPCLRGLVDVGAWSDETHTRVLATRDLLWRVRNRLHLAAGKRDDVLDLARANELAPGLGYASADDLFAALSAASAHVTGATTLLVDWVKARAARPAVVAPPLRRYG